jgi:hypothetical protein
MAPALGVEARMPALPFPVALAAHLHTCTRRIAPLNALRHGWQSLRGFIGSHFVTTLALVALAAGNVGVI